MAQDPVPDIEQRRVAVDQTAFAVNRNAAYLRPRLDARGDPAFDRILELLARAWDRELESLATRMHRRTSQCRFKPATLRS
jgi:hypothetical protein